MTGKKKISDKNLYHSSSKKLRIVMSSHTNVHDIEIEIILLDQHAHELSQITNYIIRESSSGR